MAIAIIVRIGAWAIGAGGGDDRLGGTDRKRGPHMLGPRFRFFVLGVILPGSPQCAPSKACDPAWPLLLGKRRAVTAGG
jgi:hypothetical protein